MKKFIFLNNYNLIRIFVGIIAIIALGTVYSHKKMPAGSDSYEGSADDDYEIHTDTEENIYVFVCGNVINPGVIQCKTNTRVFEAIEQCGGVNDEADITMLNMAGTLKDGDRLYVPSINEQETSSQGGLVNINRAGKEELMTLPGIGEAKAKDIIAYRTDYGFFQSIEDIMLVSGIKNSAFEKIKQYICV